MSSILKKQDIVDVLWGATLLGGGGGGSLRDGLDLVANLEENHPEIPVELKLITAEEMDEGAYAAVTAGMGAPSAIKGIDFGPYAVNAFEALKDMAAKMKTSRELKYCLAVETGGFNTFAPMFISILQGYPFIDADGCGRAVPALNTLLMHINGCDTSPLAMANGANDKVVFETADPRNAELAEEIGRHICMAFKMLSGLSGWMLTKDEIIKNIVTGSITLSGKIGKILRDCIDQKALKDVFVNIARAGIPAKQLCIGNIATVETKQESGFDYGRVTVKDITSAQSYIIFFQNENLLISKVVDGKEIPYMTVPDIICMYDMDSGIPLTNADVKEGMTVGLGLIAADQKWWKNPDMFLVWKTFMNRIGYQGGCLPYKSL